MGDAADCGKQELTEFRQRQMNGKPLENYRTH